MRVLSLFDGISCGRVALERAGITIERYVAYEIEPSAIKIAQKNYPNTEQCGDVTTADFSQYKGEIDLLIGGSPCQSLSIYKTSSKEGLTGLEDMKKSGLLYYYIKALQEIQPKYFLLENVASMPNVWRDIITNLLGTNTPPILINSDLVSAQHRERLYWTNIPNASRPQPKNIKLKDIVLPIEEVESKYWYGEERPFEYNGDDKKVQCTMLGKGFMRNTREVYNLNATTSTLMRDGDGGNRVKKIYQDGRVRRLTPVEYERLQTLPDNYTEGVANNKRYSAIGNAWTVDIISHLFKGLKEE